jgi:hypothetical protein
MFSFFLFSDTAIPTGTKFEEILLECSSAWLLGQILLSDWLNYFVLSHHCTKWDQTFTEMLLNCSSTWQLRKIMLWMAEISNIFFWEPTYVMKFLHLVKMFLQINMYITQYYLLEPSSVNKVYKQMYCSNNQILTYG